MHARDFVLTHLDGSMATVPCIGNEGVNELTVSEPVWVKCKPNHHIFKGNARLTGVNPFTKTGTVRKMGFRYTVNSSEILAVEPTLRDLLSQDTTRLRGEFRLLAKFKYKLHWRQTNAGKYYIADCTDNCEHCALGHKVTKWDMMIGINQEGENKLPTLGLFRHQGRQQLQASRHHKDLLILDGNNRYVNTGKLVVEEDAVSNPFPFIPAYKRLVGLLTKLLGDKLELEQSPWVNFYFDNHTVKALKDTQESGASRWCPRTGVPEWSVAWCHVMQNYKLPGEDPKSLQQLQESQIERFFEEGYKQVTRGRLLMGSDKVYNEWPCIEGVPMCLTRRVYPMATAKDSSSQETKLQLIWEAAKD